MVRELESKGAALKAIEQPIDASTAAGRAFLQMLGVFAEFETAIRRERQLEGIEAAKAKGVYKGRPATIKPESIAALKAEGLRRQRDCEAPQHRPCQCLQGGERDLIGLRIRPASQKVAKRAA